MSYSAGGCQNLYLLAHEEEKQAPHTELMRFGSTYWINFRAKRLLQQKPSAFLNDIRRSKAAERKERLFDETLEKTVCQETQDDTIDNIPAMTTPSQTCQLNQSVCTVSTIIWRPASMFSSVHVSSNQVFMSCINNTTFVSTLFHGRHYSVDWTTGLDYWTHRKCLRRIKEQDCRTPKSLATLATALQVAQSSPNRN